MGNIKMEIKGEKFISFLKKYGYFFIAGLVIVAITLTVLLTSLKGNAFPKEDEPLAVETSVSALTFLLPLSDCSVVMDFCLDPFIFNETLGWFEANVGVVLKSETSKDVLAACSGTVVDMSYDDLTGTLIKIQHNNEFSSTYASLDKNVNVKIGDNVNAGQKIGTMSNSRGTTTDLGDHLYFELIKNNNEVNPNDYLNFGNK
jgi:hypothetical protein